MNKTLKRNHGFTLIELLVVMSIIGLLASIVFTNLTSSKERAKIAGGLKFSSQLYHASGANAVGFWNFDDGAATDMSGSNNNGTLTGVVSSSDVPVSAMKNSFYFNGSSYITVSYNSSLLIGASGFTYMAWIKPTAIPNQYNMFMGQYLPYFNVNQSGVLHLSFNAGGQRNTYGATVVSLNKWHHVAATYDRNGLVKIYLDGEDDTASGSGPWSGLTGSASNFYIGKWNNDATYPFTGYIDDVVFMNTALDVAVIKEHYVQGLQEHAELAVK